MSDNLNLISESSRPQLELGYYLNYFNHLTTFVENTYDDILTRSEVKWLSVFRSLGREAQFLYVRLLQRTGPYFHTEKIHYPEIDKIEKAMTELDLAGFAEFNPFDDLEVYLELLTKSQLEDLAFQWNLKLPKAGKKDSWIDKLSDHGSLERLFKSHRFLALNKEEIFQKYCFLFFTNRFQGLTEFVTHELEIVKREEYSISKNERFFKSREMFLNLYQLSLLNEEIWFAIEEDDFEECERLGLQLKKISKKHSRGRRAKSLFRLGHYFERRGLVEEALEYYQLSGNSEAREREIRLLIKCEEFQKAKEAALKIISDPFHPFELEFANKIIEKIKHKLGEEYQKQKKIKINEEKWKIKRTEKKVEDDVISFLVDSGWQAYHTENHLFASFLGLLLWDEVFTHIDGVFFHPFQDGPVDLWTPDFYAKRKLLIEKKFKMFLSGEWSLVATFYEKQGLSHSWVSWKKVDLFQLEALFDRVDSEKLVTIFRQMLLNPKLYFKGFPDIFSFREDSRELLFVEVKAEGDQIRPHQRKWINYFSKLGVPTIVAHVPGN